MAEEEGSAQQKEVVHVCWDVHSLGDCRLGGERAYKGRYVQFKIF